MKVNQSWNVFLELEESSSLILVIFNTDKWNKYLVISYWFYLFIHWTNMNYLLCDKVLYLYLWMHNKGLATQYFLEPKN